VEESRDLIGELNKPTKSNENFSTGSLGAEICNLVYGNKNTNHQQMQKESFIINRNTLLHVSTLLGCLQGELFCCRRNRREFTPPKTTQYTVNSTFSLRYKVQPLCNDNKKVLPEDDPARSKHVGVCYD
jgi:hypothetical protein